MSVPNWKHIPKITYAALIDKDMQTNDDEIKSTKEDTYKDTVKNKAAFSFLTNYKAVTPRWMACILMLNYHST